MLNKSSSEEEIISYIEKDSFDFLCRFRDKPWAKPYLDKAAKSAAERDSILFMQYFENKSWAKPYLKTAAEKLAKINPEYYMESLAQDYPEYFVAAAYSLGD